MNIVVVAVLISNYIRAEQEEAARFAEYNEAVTVLDERNYTETMKIFMELGDYRDSAAQIEQVEAEKFGI